MQGHGTNRDHELKRYLEETISRTPDDYNSLVKLGILLFEPYHDPEQSLQILRKAADIAPTREEAWFWIAKCYYHYYFDPNEALAALEKALHINPNRADCLSLKASVLIELNAPMKDALKSLDKCLAIAPDWITPRKEKIMILIKMKRFDEAEQEVSEALSLPEFTFTPADSIEDYYEESVTGRSRPTRKEELLKLRALIQRKGKC